jgi:predicted esterase
MSSSSSPLPRLPLKSDFPPSLTLDIIPPSSGQAINILLLLHGLGDTQIPFTTLGRQLALPETVCISVRGINPIPSLFTGSEEPAFHWGDDVVFDDSRGEIDFDAGFERTVEVIGRGVVRDVLIGKCAFPARNILFYGFGQGAMAALSIVAASDLEFGGVVSVGGRLSSSVSAAEGMFMTPVLVCGGSRSTQITRSAVDALKSKFTDVEYVRWTKVDDSMPRSREEMLPIMKFFARRLRSRAGVPEGAVEV